MTRRSFLSALATVPLLRFLEPLARWIAPAPALEPNYYFAPLVGQWEGVLFYESPYIKKLGYGPLGLDSEPPEWAKQESARQSWSWKR